MGTGKESDALERLVKQARNDPEFFHSLVWDTEKALGSIDYLSRQEKAAILSVRPEDLIGGLAGGRFGGLAAACGGSCGASCGATCGASCGGSCTVTCAASCPLTGAVVGDAEQVINPGDFSMNLGDQIQQAIGGSRFTRYRR